MSGDYRSEFSLRELRELYGEDTEGVTEVMELFAEDAPPRLEQYTEAMEREEYETAVKAVHGLTNLLGAVRNHAGASVAREIEQNLRRGDLEEAHSARRRIAIEVETTLARIAEAK